MPRSQQAIVERIDQQRKNFLDFQTEVLINYLDFEHASAYLTDEARSDEWQQSDASNRAFILDEMKNYMIEFGLPKCLGHRGLSAGRTIDKMRAWLWLLEDETTLAYVSDDDHYQNYGAPMLKRICEQYGFEQPADPRFARMAQGLSCVPGCRNGCEK